MHRHRRPVAWLMQLPRGVKKLELGLAGVSHPGSSWCPVQAIAATPAAAMQDFEDKEYNIKGKGKGYWELGRLGPDLETEELQAKVRQGVRGRVGEKSCRWRARAHCHGCAWARRGP